jgi:hypothetical protein
MYHSTTGAIEAPATTQVTTEKSDQVATDGEFQVLDTFLYTTDSESMLVILCQRENQLFVTGTVDIKVDLTETDLATWNSIPIDLEMIHPRFEPCIMTKVGDSHASNIFVKRPGYVQELTCLGLNIALLPYLDAQLMLRDVEISETLKMWPHPNIATYYGVEVSNQIHWQNSVVGIFPRQLVTGLCFERYDCTLEELVDRKEHEGNRGHRSGN